MSHLIDGEIREITLFIDRYSVQRRAQWPFANSPKFEARYLIAEADMMLRAIQDVLIQRQCMAEYPSNWKEALKERFAPAWALRRWPVRKTRIDMEVLYPEVALPEKAHTIRMKVWEPTDWLPSYTS